jgi:hypothetical protein
VVLPSAAFARDLPEAGFGRAWAGRISPRCRQTVKVDCFRVPDIQPRTAATALQHNSLRI